MAIICLAFPAALGAQGPSAPQNPPASQSYMLIGAERTSTMEKELSDALAAGYRVRSAWNRGSGKELVLQKSADPGPFESRVIQTNADARVEGCEFGSWVVSTNNIDAQIAT